MSRPFYKTPKVLQNDTKAGTAADAYLGTPLAFDKVCETVDVFIFTNAAIVKRSRDGTNWDDEFEAPADTMYSFDCKTHSINIKNKTAGNNAVYSIVGFF